MDYLAAFSMLFWWVKPTRFGSLGLGLPDAEDGDGASPSTSAPASGPGSFGAPAFFHGLYFPGAGQRGKGWRWETETDPASPGAPTSLPATPWTSWWPNGTSWSCGGRTARRWRPSGRWGRTR